jgi:predicted NBD/HSP70 family sugar kinase
MRVLVIDIGGTHVKCIASDRRDPVRFDSGPNLTPEEMVSQVLAITKGWRYDVVSIGYPGVVRNGEPVREPVNLGSGWTGFNFTASLGHPVRLVNDAAMQALGSYDGGKMLFLGLGTGLGSTLVVDGTIVAMELAHLQYTKGRDYEHYLGNQGRKRIGDRKWQSKLEEIVEAFHEALLPDYIVLGGGNAARLKRLPAHTRRGNNADAFQGGFRLWEPQDRSPAGGRNGEAWTELMTAAAPHSGRFA